jgi:hypothetical protein
VGNKIRKVTLSVLLAGLAAVLLAPSAEAMRLHPPPSTTSTTESGYVPPPKYGRNPFPDPGPEPDPYAGAPGAAPTVVPVALPGPAPDVSSTPGPQVLDRVTTRPEPKAPGTGVLGGILSRTGSETMPLVRAGLATFALGLGLVVMARRRRTALIRPTR